MSTMKFIGSGQGSIKTGVHSNRRSCVVSRGQIDYKVKCTINPLQVKFNIIDGMLLAISIITRKQQENICLGILSMDNQVNVTTLKIIDGGHFLTDLSNKGSQSMKCNESHLSFNTSYARAKICAQ